MRVRVPALSFLTSPPSLWRRGVTRTPLGDLLVLTPSADGQPANFVLGSDGAPLKVQLPDGPEVGEIALVPDWTVVEPVLVGVERSRQAGGLGLLPWSKLSRLRVGIAGVGGLGSNLATALAMEGVCELVLADPDILGPTDSSRWPEPIALIDFGRPKVDVIGRLARELNPEVRVTTIQGDIQGFSTFSQFLDCDIIVAACDSARARRAIAAIGSRYLVPTLSIGTGVFGTAEEPLIGFEGAVSLPGDRCLACTMGLDRRTAQIADESREFGRGRLGSLRSINMMAVSWALRSIEELVAGRLLRSTAIRCVYEDGEIRQSSVPTGLIRDCFCSVYGFADEGL
ncbi:MAG: ThiF family adenylyltransferase [Methanoregulaceae archaeon]|nr:ThiF family adenylyltransferase [Methanoregulaceae archaeon]